MPNTETGGIKGIAEPAFGGEHSEEEEEGEERDEKGDGEDGLRIVGIQFQPIQWITKYAQIDMNTVKTSNLKPPNPICTFGHILPPTFSF